MNEHTTVLSFKETGLEEITKLVRVLERDLRRLLESGRTTGGYFFDKEGMALVKGYQKSLRLVNQELKLTKKQMQEAVTPISPEMKKAQTQAVRMLDSLSSSEAKKSLNDIGREVKENAQAMIDARTKIQGKEFTITSQETILGADLDKLKELHPELQNVKEATRRVNRRFVETADGIKMVGEESRVSTRDVRRFRMEMLSILFFGMSMSRMWKQHTDAMDELFGLTDYNAAAMQYLLLPAYEAFAPVAMEFNDWLLSLDETTRFWVGSIVLSIQKVGEFLMVLGQISLGVQGLQTLLGKGKIAAAFTKMGSAIKGIPSGAIAAFKGLWTFILANPIAAVIIAAAAALTLFVKGLIDADWEGHKRRMQAVVDIMDNFLERLDSLNEKVQERLGPSITGVVDLMHDLTRVSVEDLGDEFSDLIVKVEDLRNQMLIPPQFGGPGVRAAIELERSAKRMGNIIQSYLDTVAFKLRPIDVDVKGLENLAAQVQIELELGKGPEKFRENFSNTLIEMGQGLKQTLREFTIEFKNVLPPATRIELENLAEEFGILSDLFKTGKITARDYVNRVSDIRTELNRFADVFVTQSIEEYYEAFQKLLAERQAGILTEEQYLQAIEELNRGIDDSASVFKQSLLTYDTTIDAFEDATGTYSSLTLDYALEVDEASELLDRAVDSAEETKSRLTRVMEQFFGEDMTKHLRLMFKSLEHFGFNVPKFAAGGIVTKPTLAMVGEEGPEAIVPLTGGGGTNLAGDINIYVNAPISNSTDAKSLVNEVIMLLKREIQSGVLI
jgi:uncharacterized membrane protein YfbV (UPF0208 family)